LILRVRFATCRAKIAHVLGETGESALGSDSSASRKRLRDLAHKI